MYTQHSTLRGRLDGVTDLTPHLTTLKAEDRVTRRLLSQIGDKVTVVDGDGDVQTLSSLEFFSTHGEATPDECDGFGKAREPLKLPRGARAAADADADDKTAEKDAPAARR